MLTVRSYSDGEAFFREVAQPFAARPILNNVFVGVANRTRDDASGELLRVGVFEGARPVLGALRTPPHRMQLCDLGEGEAATRALADHLAERRVSVPGVMGLDPLPEHFAEHWLAITGRRATTHVRHGLKQNLYQVERVVPPTNVAGRMRPARADERAMMVKWETGFAIDGGLPATEQDPAYIEKLVDDGLADRAFALWEVDGVPVSTARIRRVADYAGRVSGVYTPRELRGHGYAAALTAAISQMVLSEGLMCCLFADAANPLTNRLYQRIGYRHLATFTDIMFA